MNRWMKNLPDFLKISDINLVGTHDTCARFIKLSRFSRCQNRGIKEQLNSGIRFLDIRLKKEDVGIKCVHDFLSCYINSRKRLPMYFDDVLGACKEFLSQNPSECIIMSVKRDGGSSESELWQELDGGFFQNPAYNRLFYKDNKIPSLGEVRGKIVILSRIKPFDNRDFPEKGCGIDLTPLPHNPKALTPYDSVKICGGRENLFVQDRYMLPAREKWQNGVLPTLSNAPRQGVTLNFLSASSLKRTPKSYGKYIRKKLAGFKFKTGVKYGWIIMDFPRDEDIRRIILTNF